MPSLLERLLGADPDGALAQSDVPSGDLLAHVGGGLSKSALEKALLAIQAPRDAYRGDLQVFDPATGHVSDEALGRATDMAGLAMTGGLGGAPKGAIGAGPSRKVADLPMDTAARMARAEGQGYNPHRFYHATDKDFPGFDLKQAGSGSNAGLKEKAVFLTDNPAVADSYLPGYHVRADSSGAIEHGVADQGAGVGRLYGEGSQVIPSMVRDLDKFEVWDIGGGGYDPSLMKQALKEAKAAKAPGVLFRGARDPGIMDASGPLGSPRAPSNILAVLDPSVIRSPNAAFDPAKMKKSDLLASLAALGLIPGAAVANLGMGSNPENNQ